jgi:osmotically-inducible protein OsmY
MRMGDAGWDRIDRELQRRVSVFLSQQVPRLRTVEVEVCQGVVTIVGRVNSFYERQLCISCCQRVAGVINLNDKVEVAQPSTSAPHSSTCRPRIALAS